MCVEEYFSRRKGECSRNEFCRFMGYGEGSVVVVVRDSGGDGWGWVRCGFFCRFGDGVFLRV